MRVNTQIRIEEARDALRYIRTLARLCGDMKNDALMKTIASNPNTPSTVLRTIAFNTTNEELLARLAANTSTPGEVIHALAKHESKEVRLAVANNQNASMLSVRPLTFDESPTVRFTLAENPFTDKYVLEKLSLDENPFVANRAELTLEKKLTEEAH